MSEGTGFRDQVTDFITHYGSTLTIYDRDPTIGNYGGYEPATKNEDAGTSTLAIPSNYLKTREGEEMGPLLAGEVMVVIRYSDTIDKDSNVGWQDDDYKVTEIKEVYLQNTIVAKRLRLSRRLD